MSRMSSISVWSSRLTRRKGQWVVDEGLLRSLVPLHLLDGAELKTLVGRSQAFKIRAGARLGGSTGQCHTVYLLSGIVEVLSGEDVSAVVAAGTEASRQPLLSARPGAMSVRAKTDATILKVGVDTDELMFHGGYASEYEVSDIDSATGTDWLTRFLQAKVFMRLPPSNIQKLIGRMEEVEAGAGQVIMRQDETDDYYYIVKEGVCRVTTRSPAGDGDIHLTELRVGDGFGEDALITNGRRGATVTMVNDGRLMRLAKEDFTSLLVEPVLRYVTWNRARSLLNEGAVVLDVRQPDEFARDGAAAVNIPLGLLRSRAQELDAGRVHITVSNVLNRSSAAAFLLCQQGMDVYILQDGAQAVALSPHDHRPPLRVVPEQASAPPSEACPGAAGLTLVPSQQGGSPPQAPPEPGGLSLVPAEAVAGPAVAEQDRPPLPEMQAVPVTQGEDERSSLRNELAAVKRQLVQEVEKQAHVEGRVKQREEQLQELQGHLDKARVRLKKVVSVARTADGKCRDLQSHIVRLEEQKAALRQAVGDRERRLAESELLRRKLERTVAVLRAQRVPPSPEPVPERADAAVTPGEDKAAPSQAMALPVSPPPADPPPSGGRLRTVMRYGAWALLLMALSGVTSIALYDMTLKQHSAAHAARGHGASAGAGRGQAGPHGAGEPLRDDRAVRNGPA